jgi:hypothetical protein
VEATGEDHHIMAWGSRGPHALEFAPPFSGYVLPNYPQALAPIYIQYPYPLQCMMVGQITQDCNCTGCTFYALPSHTHLETETNLQGSSPASGSSKNA